MSRINPFNPNQKPSKINLMKTKTENPPVTIGRDDSYDGKECLKLVVADGIKALYVEMNGRTYYIDDSTGEQIMDNWID